jgi:hypothetical protein
MGRDHRKQVHGRTLRTVLHVTTRCSRGTLCPWAALTTAVVKTIDSAGG